MNRVIAVPHEGRRYSVRFHNGYVERVSVWIVRKNALAGGYWRKVQDSSLTQRVIGRAKEYAEAHPA